MKESWGWWCCGKSLVFGLGFRFSWVSGYGFGRFRVGTLPPYTIRFLSRDSHTPFDDPY